MGKIGTNSKKDTSKKSYGVVAGLFLTIVGGFVFLFVMLLPFTFMGVVVFFIITLPAILFYINDIRRKKLLKLSVIGLIINSFIVILFSIYVLLSIYTVFLPLSVNQLKYRFIFNNSFWLDFDENTIDTVNCRYGFLLGGHGLIHFRSNGSKLYESDKIIVYAEENGWAYRGKAEFSKSNILASYNNKGDKSHFEETDNSELLTILFEGYSLEDYKIWIKDTCTALSFDTGHYAGVPSYVIVRHDGKEMLVRDNSKLFAPDTSDVLMLPEIFKDEKNTWQDVHYY